MSTTGTTMANPYVVNIVELQGITNASGSSAATTVGDGTASMTATNFVVSVSGNTITLSASDIIITGNLTVNGSVSITGDLTVGGTINGTLAA
jgi:hypothetical protein